jgi:hypothetical protein
MILIEDSVLHGREADKEFLVSTSYDSFIQLAILG